MAQQQMREHERLNEKQGTRLLKCQCATCGYTVRVTRKWLGLAGPPICPTDNVRMMLVGAPATPLAA